jgi:hypothetical protein
MVIETSRPVAVVAKELGINESTLGNWVNAYRRDHRVAAHQQAAQLMRSEGSRHAGVPRIRVHVWEQDIGVFPVDFAEQGDGIYLRLPRQDAGYYARAGHHSPAEHHAPRLQGRRGAGARLTRPVPALLAVRNLPGRRGSALV